MAIYVENGITSNDLGVQRNTLNVLEGGIVSNTTLNEFGMVVLSDGSANEATAYAAGDEVKIYSYGSLVKQGTEFTGEIIDYDGNNSMFVSSGGTVNNTTIKFSATVHISSGGIANNTTVTENWSILKISSGGIANDTAIYSGGILDIYSGGTANNTTVNSDCYMYVSSGATALQIKENGGTVDLESGANATFASNTINGITLSNTSMTVHENTVANNTTINHSGRMYIYSGGTANSTTLNDDMARMYNRGGTVNNTTVIDGQMYVYSSGTANNTTVFSRFMYVYSHGTANYTTIDSASHIAVYSSGTANYTTIINSGYMNNSSGGTANYTTVNSGCYMYVYSGATANCTTINSGGNMIIDFGGINRGALQMESGATVSAYSGAIIDFTVADRTSADDYLINNLSLIQGTPTYTITVSADQAYGTYKLAQGASNFAGTISIGTEDTTYGSITVNGEDLVYEGIAYSLDLVDGNLTFSIIKSATIDGSGMTQADAIAAGYDLIITTGGTYESNFGHDGVKARIEGGTLNCTVGGGAVTSSANYKTWDVQENETSLTITGGTFNKVVMGGDRVNYGNCEHVGDLNLTIEGGMFNSQIAGGMAYADQSHRGQALLTGDVNMTLAGGTFKSRIYGGCISMPNYSTRTAIEGNINIVVDSSENELIFEDNVYIVAGSYQSGAIDGNVQVTFTGLGKNLKMDADNLVWGGCSTDVYLINGDTRTFQSTISGTRTICFNNFTGEFNTGIRGFNIFTAENGSKLEILASNHLRDIEQWNLDWDTQLSGAFQNDFKGDTMNIDLTGWDQTATNLFDCAAGTFTGFEAMKKVTIGNETAKYSEALSAYVSTNYMLTLRDNQTMQLSMNTTIA